MSTTYITLTPQQDEYAYKKVLGVAYENPGAQPSSETVSSLPFIFNTQIISNNVPIDAPTLDISSNLIGGGVKWTTMNENIFYYEKLPLRDSINNSQYAFVYDKNDFLSNLTTQSIPSTYDPNGSYSISVYSFNGSIYTEISSSSSSMSWIFDTATGCLTFITQKWNNVYPDGTFPYISFYRYEGPFGINSLAEWDISGNNIYYNSGNVGIGTANPSYTLHVSGNTMLSGDVIVKGRTYQDISYNSVTGYYALDKDKFPIPDPSITGLKAISNWTLRTGSTQKLNKIAWSPELRLFAGCRSDNDGFRISTSPDSINWTTRSTPQNNDYRDITWSSKLGLFVSVATGGTSNVIISSNGITWTGVTAPLKQWISVIWSKELEIFCAVSNNGGTMISSDGINWTANTTSIDAYNGITWSPELKIFVATGYTGNFIAKIGISYDGLNWIKANLTGQDISSNALGRVDWCPELGLFATISSAGGTGNRFFTSSDGLVWSTRISPYLSNWSDIKWINQLGLFLACAQSGNFPRLAVSYDGIIWNTISTSPGVNINGIGWSKELGIAVLGSASGNYSSYLKARLPTSYNIFDSSFNNIDENGNWTFSNNIYLATNSGNNVGIGTSTPSYTLDVSGIASFSDNVYLATNSGNNVGIGTSTPSYTLDISGNLNVNQVITNTIVQPSSNDNSTKVPTTAWVQTAISSISNPIGTILAYAGINSPTGYLFCDGSVLSTTTYSNLFSVIGYTYGGSSSSFNLPDFRDRMPLGSQNTSTIQGITQNSNSIVSSITGGNKQIQPQQFLHTHNIKGNVSSNEYVYSCNQSGNTSTGGGSTRLVNDNRTNFGDLQVTGSDANLNQKDFRPPWIAVNFIIKF